GHAQPLRMHQRFAGSQQPRRLKQLFIDDLPARRFGPALAMLCGESNILSTTRPGELRDPFSFNARLFDLGVTLVLNPVHDYMVRPEMVEKRRVYSTGGRTVVSVWNRGKLDRHGRPIHEPRLPWTVFHDGANRTAAVRQLPRPLPDRPDLQIGVLSLRDL
ncbi:MAG: hypothetical protein JO112_22280, partial [Planctomycetes bacterium]|nr:hypothetical protein [Planctomycetota bacterium]